jgi:Dimerisation domain
MRLHDWRINARATDSRKILQTGLAFWASKTLMSAVEMGVFTELSRGPERFDAISGRLGLHSRSARDFLDALVALGFLEREGDLYNNTPETDLFLDRKKPSYVGGVLEMANHRGYPFWGHLTEALRTGAPQNELKAGTPGLWETLYADPARLKEVLAAMTSISRGANMRIARALPWADYRTFVDVETAQGDLAVQIAEEANAYMRGDAFSSNPIGVNFDPDELVEQFKKGVPKQQLLARPEGPPAPIPREHGLGA